MSMKKRILPAAAAAVFGLSCLMIPVPEAQAAGSVSRFVSSAIAIARDDSHGYSDSNRWGPDYDCSSYIITALRNAGFNTNGATYTGNMRSALTGAGWSYYPASSMNLSGTSRLKSGDILIKSGHAEIYVGSGQRAGAHKNYDGRQGDSSGREISISSYYNGGWAGVLRYTGQSSSSGTASVRSAAVYSTGTYKTTINLNMRQKASISSKVLRNVKKGTKVSVTKVSGSWGKIKYSGKTGWVSFSYLKKVSTSSTASKAVKTGKYKTTINLNMRQKASISSKVLRNVKKGTKVSVTKISGSWGKIKYSGKTGWVALKYLKKA
jgi:SH3-like domain-containing protein